MSQKKWYPQSDRQKEVGELGSGLENSIASDLEPPLSYPVGFKEFCLLLISRPCSRCDHLKNFTKESDGSGWRVGLVHSSTPPHSRNSKFPIAVKCLMEAMCKSTTLCWVSALSTWQSILKTGSWGHFVQQWMCFPWAAQKEIHSLELC